MAWVLNVILFGSGEKWEFEVAGAYGDENASGSRDRSAGRKQEPQGHNAVPHVARGTLEDLSKSEIEAIAKLPEAEWPEGLLEKLQEAMEG